MPAGGQIEALFVREESERQRPYGRALELGCGSGIWSVKLAERGWDVTGIDNVPKALGRARRRASEARVAPRFLQADVTTMSKSGAGTGFDLILDVGCFHELSDAQRVNVGREVSAMANADATILLMAWERSQRSPMYPHGVTGKEIETAFPGWRIVHEEPMDVTGAPSDVQKANPRWYRLRRN